MISEPPDVARGGLCAVKRGGKEDVKKGPKQQIRASVNVYRLMETDTECSVETRCLGKKVTQSKLPWDAADLLRCE